MDNEYIQVAVRKLICLLLLPGTSITAAFYTIVNGLDRALFQHLKQLLEYVLNTWITKVGVDIMSCEKTVVNIENIEKVETIAEHEIEYTVLENTKITDDPVTIFDYLEFIISCCNKT